MIAHPQVSYLLLIEASSASYNLTPVHDDNMAAEDGVAYIHVNEWISASHATKGSDTHGYFKRFEEGDVVSIWIIHIYKLRTSNAFRRGTGISMEKHVFWHLTSLMLRCQFSNIQGKMHLSVFVLLMNDGIS